MAFSYSNPKGQGNRVGQIAVSQTHVTGNLNGSPAQYAGFINRFPSLGLSFEQAQNPDLNYLINGDGGSSALGLNFHWANGGGHYDPAVIPPNGSQAEYDPEEVAFLTFDFGEAVSFEKVTITAVPFVPYCSVQWQGSNDGITYHNVANPIVLRFAPAGPTKYFTYAQEFPGPADTGWGGDPLDGCRYWRLARAWGGFQEGNGIPRILQFDFKIDAIGERPPTVTVPTGNQNDPASYPNIFGAGVRGIGPDKMVTITPINCSFAGGGAASWVDGIYEGNTGTWPTSLGSAPYGFLVEFMRPVALDHWQSVQDLAANNGNWLISGSDDGLTFTDLLSFPYTDRWQMVSGISPGRPYKFYRWLGQSWSNSPYHQELFFGVAQHPVERGDRSALITMSTNLDVTGGDIQNIVDGTEGYPWQDTATYVLIGSQSAADKFIEFDFGDEEYVVTGMQVVGTNSVHFGDASFKAQAWNGVAWVDVSGELPFDLLDNAGFSVKWDNDEIGGGKFRIYFTSGNILGASNQITEINLVVIGALAGDPPVIGPFKESQGPELVPGISLGLAGHLHGAGARITGFTGSVEGGDYRILERVEGSSAFLGGTDSYGWYYPHNVVDGLGFGSNDYRLPGGATLDQTLLFGFNIRDALITGFQIGAPSGYGGDLGMFAFEMSQSMDGPWDIKVPSFAWSGRFVVQNFENEKRYRYGRFRGLSGTISEGERISEVEFRADGYDFERGSRNQLISITTTLDIDYGTIDMLLDGSDASGMAFLSQDTRDKVIEFDFKGRDAAIRGVIGRGMFIDGLWQPEAYVGGEWVLAGPQLRFAQDSSGTSRYYHWDNEIGGAKWRLRGLGVEPIDYYSQWRELNLVGTRITASTFNYFGWGGKGARAAWLKVTTDLAFTGTLEDLLDGKRDENPVTLSAQNIAGKVLRFDFRAPVDLHDFRIFANKDDDGSLGTWFWEYSDDDSTWTAAAPGTLGIETNAGLYESANGVQFISGRERHRYWRLKGSEGTIAATELMQIEFAVRSAWFEAGNRSKNNDNTYDPGAATGSLVFGTTGGTTSPAYGGPPAAFDGREDSVWTWDDLSTAQADRFSGKIRQDSMVTDVPNEWWAIDGFLIRSNADVPGAVWQATMGDGDPVSETMTPAGGTFNPYTTEGVFVPISPARRGFSLSFNGLSGPVGDDVGIVEILLHAVPYTPPDAFKVEFEDDGKLIIGTTDSPPPSNVLVIRDETVLTVTASISSPPFELAVTFRDDAVLSVREHNERPPPIQIFINVTGR